MKLISVVTGCFNEEDNVDELHARIRAQFECLPAYDYEHIFIDNASTDATVARIKALAARDHRVKLIVNTRNFGHIRSPIHALLQARGDAVISMASDLQEPPELIPEFIARWEQGYRVVAGVKPRSQHTTAMFYIRRFFYATIGRISDTRLIPNFTGFGLYDRSVVEVIRQMDDPYPYFRGMIADIGFEHAEIPFVQPGRRRGLSKNNFYTLYDMAILGITSHSKLPIRLATMAGFGLSAHQPGGGHRLSGLQAVRWDQFSVGIAPVVIGFFFFASVQLFFIGVLGEYIAAIHTQVRPLVVERERINFDRRD
jgi:glycosyltransferase involved in cell wall biosynthesis